MNKDTIGKNFTLLELGKFVIVPVLSRFFISFLCTIDDGLFISRCCGEYSLAAFSLLSPYFNGICIFCCLVYGISTFCSIKLGERKKQEAQESFSMMLLFSLALGLVLSILIAIFKQPFLHLIGATDILLPYAESYLSVALIYIPLILGNEVFSGFFTIAGKPALGAYITIIQTICNFFFDWLFMVKMRLGLAGTAYSNLIGNLVIFILSLIFFLNKKQEFQLVKPKGSLFFVLKKSFNFGLTSASTCLILCFTGFIINKTLLKIGQEEILAAYAIVNTLQNMFIASFSALFSATSPLVSYRYGEKDKKRIIHILKQILILFVCLLILDTAVLLFFKKALINLYLSGNNNLKVHEMATYGLSIIPLVLPFFGLNSFVQNTLVAIDKQKFSLILSLMENGFLAILVILILPNLFGINGIWYSFLIRETLAFIFTFSFLLNQQKTLPTNQAKKL